MNMFNLDRLMITEDSFGSDLPHNWEAIASRLNTEIFDRIATEGIEDPQEAYEIASSVWEDYCNNSDEEEEEETAMRTIYDFADVVNVSTVERLRGQSIDDLFRIVDNAGSWDAYNAAEALLVIAEKRGELDKVYDAEEWTDYFADIYEDVKAEAAAYRKEVAMNTIGSYMDDEIREQVHWELAPCSEEAFLDRYLELDPDFQELLDSELSYWEKIVRGEEA